MDVTIDVTGFELDAGSRKAIEQHIRQQLEQLAIARLELAIAWRDADLFGPRVQRYETTARTSLASGAVLQCTIEDAQFAKTIDDAVASVASQVERRRLLEHPSSPCGWCGGSSFALAPRSFAEVAADALVCVDCGHVELFVRDPHALAGALVVHARAKSPYR